MLYFEDQSPNQQLAAIANGLTEDLIEALKTAPGLFVVSKAGATAAKSLNASVDSIARVLKVGTLVTGVVTMEAQNLRVTMRLLDDAGLEMDRATFRRPAAAALNASEALAEQVGALVRRRVGESVRFARERARTRNSEAWLRFQRAMLARQRGDSLFLARRQAEWQEAYRSADSLAALAESLDPAWPDPALLRANLAYVRSRRAGPDTAHVRRMLDTTDLHLSRAFAAGRPDAHAFAQRGDARYWRWLMNLDGPGADRAKRLREAQLDLETAVQRNPTLASAFASLSHMYNNVPGKTLADVRIAAAKAIEADAFLDNADVILGRIALAAYDEGNFAEAQRWCWEGVRRFPLNPRFMRCRLYVFGMPEATPEPVVAWALADSLVAVTPTESERRTTRELSRVLVATALVRAGAKDSARAVLTRLDLQVPGLTPTFDMFLAHAWLALGDREASLRHFQRFIERTPGADAAGAQRSWMFRDLVPDPRFQALFHRPR